MNLSRPNRSQLFARLACAAVSVLVLWLVLRRVDVPGLGRVLGQASPGWILAAWVIFGLAFLLAAARWHLMLRLSKCAVHPTATLRTVLVGHLFNTVLLGPAGGDIAKSALYSRWYRFPTATVLASCVLDRLLGGAGFFIFAACTPGFAVYTGHFSEKLTTSNLSPSVLMGLAAAALVLVVLHFPRRRYHWPWPFQSLYLALLSNGSRLARAPRLALSGLLLAVLAHLCISLVFLFSLKAVTQTPFSLAALFWIFPVISLITSAPITFAGAGLREGAAMLFLGYHGIPATDAVAASLLVLVTFLVWAIVGGVIGWRGEAVLEKEPNRAAPKTLSVVIPTLNESQALGETVFRTRQVPEVTEIIVVDGGSTDATREIAERLGCQVLSSSRGRGGQLRLGAAQARGDVIVLVHADTWLPPESGQAILNCLRDRSVVAGGFWKTFRERKLLMAGSRFRCAARLFLFRRILGDQALFIRREALETVGGVPDIPLMEEVELCRRLRAIGGLALAGATVTTSARRFARLGVLRTYLRMWHVMIRYYFGTSTQKLVEIYEKE